MRRPSPALVAWLALSAACLLPVLAGDGAWAPGLARAQAVDPEAFARADAGAPDLAVQASPAAGRAPLALSGRRLLAGSREVYLRAADVAGLLQARHEWRAPQRRLALRAAGRAFELTAGSRLVLRGDGETLLRTPPLVAGGELWLPVEFVTLVAAPALGRSAVWDADALTLALGEERLNVTGLRVEELARATALHVRCTEPLAFRAEGAEPGWIALKIYGGRLDPRAASLDGARGLIRSVVARQGERDASLLVETSDLVATFRAYADEDGAGIVLLLEEASLGALPEPQPRGRLGVPEAAPQPAAATRPLRVRTVIVDAGHGGEETGRVGARGTLEKDVNLAVAHELRRQLERRGFDVVLTRHGDIAVPLERRAEIANQSGGDLFVSLHCNGWFDERAAGVETYFLSPARTARDAAVADAENAATGEAAGDVAFILWELVQNGYIAQSSDLAETVQAALCDALGAANRGVRQAGFRVLVGTAMPAVLVELGFLSNPDEEARLADAEHQRRVARALVDAIAAFRDRHAGPGDDEGDDDRDDDRDGGRRRR